MKILILVMMILLCMPIVFGIIIVPVAHSSPPSPNPQQQSGGCIPPIDYALKYGCALQYQNSYSVNTYRCLDSVITGDCKGNVVSVKNPEQAPTWVYIVWVVVLMFTVSVILAAVY